MIDTGDAVKKLALNVARLSGLAPLARPLLGGVGAILMLHRVTAVPAASHSVNRHLRVTPTFLDGLIKEMKADGYDFVSMDEACARLRAGGRRFAAITADDGYRDNLLEALPVLEKHQAPIAVYVAPGLIDRRVDLWWEVVERATAARPSLTVATARGPLQLDCSTPARQAAAAIRLHEFLITEVAEEAQRSVVRKIAASAGVDSAAPARESLMGWDELERFARHPLVTIGAHSVNHYHLSRLTEEKAREEIAACADILEARLGFRPRHMAYPYGYARAVSCREVALAREAGFVSAVTTRHGVLQAGHAGHMHALPRISVNGRFQRIAHVRTMLSGVTTPLANAGRMVVTV